MKKKNLILVLIFTLLFLVSCNNDTPEKKEESNVETEQKEETKKEQTEEKEPSEESKDVDFINQIVYSNMLDEASVNEVRESLIKAGISKEVVDAFLKEVKNYNETVGDVGLVKEGFVSTETLIPSYDLEKIDANWLQKNELFVGYDCRMTAFLILNNLIEVKNPSTEESAVLFMDNDAILNSNNPTFTEENINRFNTIFAGIPVEAIKDVDKHVEKVKNYVEEKKISFTNEKASLIACYIHDELDNVVFIGHTGVLVPSALDDSLLFIEKISFQEPYQALKFKNRQELNDYLMNKYDNWLPQESARPFIMENDHLLEGYRLNPNVK